jgi:Domain of unknown function (DUF4279)
MTRYSPADDTIKTFATLRVTGDDLDPDEITRILRIVPTVAYRKGQQYRAGSRTGTILGKTGVWYFSTENVINSRRLADHVLALFGAISSDYVEELMKQSQKPRQEGRVRTVQAFTLMGRVGRLSHLLRRRSFKAVLTCFWHGRRGATPPPIPRVVSAFFKLVPIAIETDFDTDESADPPRIAHAS